MKHFLLMAAMAALLLSGCQNETLFDDIPSQHVLFTAATESYEGDTRTSLDTDGNVLWKTGDQISIFQASTINEPYQVSDDSDGETTAALDKVSSGSSGFVSGTTIETNVAYYPYSSANKIKKSGSDYALTVTLPATQTYAANSFGNGAFPMAAVTTGTSDYNLKFKNVLGGLKLQLKGTAAVKSITVTGNSSEVLCGTATVTVSHTAKPSIAMTGTGATVTLDCGASGVQLNTTTATTFIVALPPMTMTGGFTVVITSTTDQTQEISTTKSQTITRSSLLVMPALTFTPAIDPSDQYEYVDLGLSVKWAKCNVGATNIYDYGDYFAWGETSGYNSGKTSFSEATYKYYKDNGSETTKDDDGFDVTVYHRGYTKYVTKSGASSYGYDGTFYDDKTTLESSDDAATVNMGSKWRMPTKSEWSELTSNCTWEWKSLNGVNGYKVTATNGNYIFLPAAGGRWGDLLNDEGSDGGYWSSTLYSGSGYAYALGFYSSHWCWSDYARYGGRSVRAVCP